MDPDVLLPSDKEYYRTLEKWKPIRRTRSSEELTQDVNKAHDNIKKLVYENDALKKYILGLQGQLAKEQTWRRWLVRALIFTWVAWGMAFWYIAEKIAPLVWKGLQVAWMH